jgi:GT2 family glycosyltransferase
MAPLVDVLVPTYNRPAALAVTLTGMVGQVFRDFDIKIADQGDEDVSQVGEVQAVTNVLRAHGHNVSFYKNMPRRGIAQQRQFLLDRSAAPYVLFLDDDVILETNVFGSLVSAIRKEACGFVGSALIGLTFIDDVRPHEQAIEFWEGKVTPETVRPGKPAWERHKLHNAANLYHVAQKLNLDPRRPLRYKVAWVGGCVLYDADKLHAVGGFSFWTELPADHAGEDVLAQLRVMDAYGGCGIIPSGVYHQQIPTTIPDREVDAPKYLDIDFDAQQNEMENT